MKLEILGSNQTQLDLKDQSLILFSYETPVAAYVADTMKWVRTSTKYSRTTQKHINEWLHGRNVEVVDQSVLDSLIEEI